MSSNPKRKRTSNKISADPLQLIPNVGPATARDLRQLGICSVTDLAHRDPWEMYVTLCRQTGQRHDPCVIDVFLACVDFANNGRAAAWWKYTSRRKAEIHRKLAWTDNEVKLINAKRR